MFEVGGGVGRQEARDRALSSLNFRYNMKK